MALTVKTGSAACSSSTKPAHEYFDHTGFQFKDLLGNTSFCLGLDGARNQNCLRGFTGSLALVHFGVTWRSKEINGPLQLLEHVRMIDRHERLPERASYDRAIEVPSGVGTDLQAFGYEPDPQAVTVPSEDDVWCLFRQDLYCGSEDKPFATLHWKHTLANIRLLDLIPGVGARLDM